MSQTYQTPAGTDPANLAIKTTLPERDEALRTLFSGASAPLSPVAYQLWADTTNKVLKQRNGANSDWVTLLPLADSVRMVVTLKASGALAAGEYQFAMPMAGRVEKVQLVPDTATTGSSAGVTEWTFALQNVTAAVALFSATPSTATTVSGVGGGELAVDTVKNLQANQNQVVAADDVLRFTVAQVGSPTAVADLSVRLVFTLVGI